MRPTIGDQIARIRRALPLTQEALAERAGVSVETIRKLEQGERTSARMSTLGAIARALGVPRPVCSVTLRRLLPELNRTTGRCR